MNQDDVRSLDDGAFRGTAAATTYTVHGLLHGGDVWLFGVQAGAQPLVEIDDGDGDGDGYGDDDTVWLAGVPFMRTSTVVEAADVPAAIRLARRKVLFAADLLCERCAEGVATGTAPPPFQDRRWCRPCIDDQR